MYTIKLSAPFRLESGEQIDNLQIGFHIYGNLNSAKDNVVWVCHALTANSDVFSWWDGLFGKNKLVTRRTELHSTKVNVWQF